MRRSRLELGLPLRGRLLHPCEPRGRQIQATLCADINSYWASEHGAIILAQTFGNTDTPLNGDARMHPLPWVDAEVSTAATAVAITGRGRHRRRR